MRTLGVKCKGCGHLIGTGITLGAYGRPHLGPAAWPCPHCHVTASYRTTDYVLVGS